MSEAMGCVYLDTSAYLAILLDERPGEALRKRLGSAPLAASVLMFVEAERNIVRLAREGHIEEEDFVVLQDRIRGDVERFLVLDLSLETIDWGRFPTVTLPRTADLVHLRAALYFMRENKFAGFCSLDKAQLQAAREMGIPLLD